MSVKVHRQDCNASPANHACIYLKINEVRLTNDNNNTYLYMLAKYPYILCTNDKHCNEYIP